MNKQGLLSVVLVALLVITAIVSPFIVPMFCGTEEPSMVLIGDVYFVAGEGRLGGRQTIFYDIHLITKEMPVIQFVAEIVQAKRIELDENKIILTALNKIGD